MKYFFSLRRVGCLSALSGYVRTQEKTEQEMKPTVGRIVHYTNLGDKDGKYPPEQQAAIVTGVYPDKPAAPGHEFETMEVDLHIFYRTGQFDMQKVPYSEKYERGHWSWPPKV